MGSMRRAPGCGCCGGCEWTQHVDGCNGNPIQEGVGSVYVYNDSGLGTLYASGTTDSNGDVTLTIPGSGTYYVVIVAGGYLTNSADASLSCGGTRNTTLTVDSSTYTCCGEYNIPNTLYCTDDNGTWALHWDGTGWQGCATMTKPNVVGPFPACNCRTPAQSGTIGYVIRMTCVSGAFVVGRRWVEANCSGGRQWNTGGCLGDGYINCGNTSTPAAFYTVFQSGVIPTSLAPFSLSASPTTVTPSGNQLGDPLAATPGIAISE